MVRTELEQTLHRTANYVECRLADLFPELLADSRIEAVSDIAYHGCRLIEALRGARDWKEGGQS